MGATFLPAATTGAAAGAGATGETVAAAAAAAAAAGAVRAGRIITGRMLPGAADAAAAAEEEEEAPAAAAREGRIITAASPDAPKVVIVGGRISTAGADTDGGGPPAPVATGRFIRAYCSAIASTCCRNAARFLPSEESSFRGGFLYELSTLSMWRVTSHSSSSNGAPAVAVAAVSGSGEAGALSRTYSTIGPRSCRRGFSDLAETDAIHCSGPGCTDRCRIADFGPGLGLLLAAAGAAAATASHGCDDAVLAVLACAAPSTVRGVGSLRRDVLPLEAKTSTL